MYDLDPVKDELAASFTLDVKEIIADASPKFFWKNIYGGPLGCHGDNTVAMNKNPDMASLWKGRILM